MPTKICKRCNECKDLTEFYQKSNTTYCKPCIKAINDDYYRRNKERIDTYRAQWHRELRKKNPEKIDEYQHRQNTKRFGRTPEWYAAQLEKQNHVCAICKLPERGFHPNGKIPRLAIDHDHRTGKVRGLLCMECNKSLGHAETQEDWILKAADYLTADMA